MSNDLSLPLASEALVDDNKVPTATWYRLWSALFSGYNENKNAVADPSTGLDTKAAKAQVVLAAWTFKFPEDETVILIPKAKEAFTITTTATIAEVGTSTVTWKINGSALGATNAGSTSIDEQAQSTGNAVAIDDQLSVTFSSTSADCENLALQLGGTIELA
jgi:hypothetical protein